MKLARSGTQFLRFDELQCNPQGLVNFTSLDPNEMLLMLASGQKSQKETFSLLQVFRGIAAILVILIHSTGIIRTDYSIEWINGFFEMGAAGVDFFFVLSGFLIFYIHHQDFGQKSRLIGYLRKRLLRIYPIYWIITLVLIPVYFLVPSFGQGNERNFSVILGSLFLWPMKRAPILVAGWTLRHEMLFYLLFAVLIWQCGLWVKLGIAGWIVALIVTAATSFNQNPDFAQPVIQVLLWPQNLEFIFGCLAAYFLTRSSSHRLGRKVYLILLPILIGAFFSAEVFVGPMWMGSGKRVLIYGVISFLLVISAVRIDQTGGLSATIRNSIPYSWLFFIGEASYSIYLVHGPCISVLFKLAYRFRMASFYGVEPVAWGIILLTIISGCFVHLMIERPLLMAFRKPRTSIATAQ